MTPEIEDIRDTVLETLGIDKRVFEKAGKSRFAPIVKARQIICYVCREVGHTCALIGWRLGITHSGVLYHVKTAKDHILYESDYADAVNTILAKLKVPCKQCTILGYVTRDEDGQLTMFADKPNRDRFQDGEGFWCGECPRELNPTLFPQITWESEPQECEMTLRLK